MILLPHSITLLYIFKYTFFRFNVQIFLIYRSKLCTYCFNVVQFFRREYFLNVEPEAVLKTIHKGEKGAPDVVVYDKEFRRERPKPGVDWYREIILCQFITVFYVALFLLGPERTMEQWTKSTLNIGYVVILLIVCLLMVFERMMYLYRSIVMKTIMHVFWVIFVVVMVHSNVYVFKN